MLITLTTVSMLAITALVWLSNRILPFKVCPICAGVFLTWSWLLGAHFLGYRIDLTVPALLMGGSVVGVAYQLEKRSRNISGERLLLWKVLFIPAGFAAAYSVLSEQWTVLLFAVVFLFLVSFLLLSGSGKPDSREEAIEDIEKKMKDCC
ncbi:MAG: hypothetical protein Q7S08_04945 [bacterium]|nr:hypothetical protein [bacterium]